MSWRQAAPWWSWALPALAWAALVLVPPDAAGGAGAAALLAVLVGSVFAAVHHAEVIAHRVGEPFGALVLAMAVTVIEVALIVSLMLASPDGKPTLARDTVFAAVIIVCNGIVGLCLLAGGARHHEQGFEVRGAASYLAVLITFATLTLVMLVGSSAMAGVIGGGGLGDLALVYGYQRFNNQVLIACVIVLVVLVQGIQMVGDGWVRARAHKR